MQLTCVALEQPQIVIGLGSGTLGVTRAYVAERTAGKDKTAKIAKLTAVQVRTSHKYMQHDET